MKKIYTLIFTLNSIICANPMLSYLDDFDGAGTENPILALIINIVIFGGIFVFFAYKSEKERKDRGRYLYRLLIASILKKDKRVGECFMNTVRFVDYKKGILKWGSKGNKEERKLLADNWGIINGSIKEVFGSETKIQNIYGSKMPRLLLGLFDRIRLDKHHTT